MSKEQPGLIRGVMRRRRRGGRGRFRLISPTGARVVQPGRLDAKSRAKAMLPSLFTLANMLCGFSAIISALNGDFSVAAVLIGIAIVLDIFDGAVARAVGAITPFGLQFDSLADLISFGISPAVLMYTWALRDFDPWGWFLACFWLACAAFRLARFNVTIDPLADKRYFTGLPSPGAAGVVIATVFAFDNDFSGWQRAIPIAVTVLPALLMATSFRFMSFRTLVSPKKNGVWVSVIFVVAIVTGLVFYPAITGLLLAYGYVAVAPVGWATAPIRRRLFGPESVAPPRHKLPSVFFPIDEDNDDDDSDDDDDPDDDSADDHDTAEDDTAEDHHQVRRR